MLQSLKIYIQPRMLLLLFLGISSGLPLPLTLSTLTLWLAEIGISKTSIGLFALTGMPYAFKFLWAPLVDGVNIPYFTKRFGRRKSWGILSQIFLMAGIIGLGISDPVHHIGLTAWCALTVAFFSATQDIVLDAYRVEILEESEYGAGSAIFVFGYRIGMLIAGAGALYLASYAAWPIVFAVMSGFMLIGVVALMFGPRPNIGLTDGHENWFQDKIINPFKQFMQHERWWYILLFIVAYKLGDAMAGIMANPFYLELGFEKIEIANITKAFGLLATLVGGFIGGAMVNKIGIHKSLLWCGILQLGSNLMFAALALVGKDLYMLALTIGIENLAGGMGTSAFVAFLSYLCAKQYTATQYALLSALASFGRTVLSSSGGAMASALNWPLFFVVTTVIAIPGVIMVKWLKK